MRQSLFKFTSESISIQIEIYFEGEKLVIDGYDIGKKVEEAWGDSDYEYVTTVEGTELTKLYPLMNVPQGDKEGLIRAFVKTYNTNTCYSQISDFLRANGIAAGGFSWT